MIVRKTENTEITILEIARLRIFNLSQIFSEKKKLSN